MAATACSLLIVIKYHIVCIEVIKFLGSLSASMSCLSLVRRIFFYYGIFWLWNLCFSDATSWNGVKIWGKNLLCGTCYLISGDNYTAGYSVQTDLYELLDLFLVVSISDVSRISLVWFRDGDFTSEFSFLPWFGWCECFGWRLTRSVGK